MAASRGKQTYAFTMDAASTSLCRCPQNPIKTLPAADPLCRSAAVSREGQHGREDFDDYRRPQASPRLSSLLGIDHDGLEALTRIQPPRLGSWVPPLTTPSPQEVLVQSCAIKVPLFRVPELKEDGEQCDIENLEQRDHALTNKKGLLIMQKKSSTQV